MECIAVNLDVPDVEDAITFYREKLGFVEGLHIPDLRDRALYATVWNGRATIMFHRHDHLPPEKRPYLGTGVTLYIDLGGASVDAYFQELSAKGVQIVKPIADEYWGARDFTIADNNGYHLTFAQQMATLTPEEMLANLEQQMAVGGPTPGARAAGPA